MNEITEKDLGFIEKLNGQGTATAAEGTPVATPVGDSFKSLQGALAAHGGSFKPYDEYLFIDGLRTQIYEFLTEQYKYENLPAGLTPYRVERKLIESGITFLVKVEDEYFAVIGSITDWNLYKEPVSFIVNEPKSSLNGRKFGPNDEWVFIRNTIKANSKLPLLYRFLTQLEKVLFQIEKNLLSSAPKGLIDTRLGSIEWGAPLQPGVKNAMEAIINGQDTFYEFKAGDNVMEGGRGAGLTSGDNKQVFIPIELTDRTESLIKNYMFLREQIKEFIGAEVNSVLGKSQRMITDEIGTQQDISTSTELHGLNIRINDWDFFNKTFNENVTVELAEGELVEAKPTGEGDN